MLKNATGLFMVHIPYRGSAPAFTDLMAGQVQFMAESIPQAAAYHKQGKVKALAVTSRERNPALPDTTLRVGRAPLRKLSRNDRFISPASQLAERGMGHAALLEAIGAGLRFDPSDDPEAVELQALLATATAAEVVATVTGLAPDHPLYAGVLAVVEARQAR